MEDPKEEDPGHGYRHDLVITSVLSISREATFHFGHLPSSYPYVAENLTHHASKRKDDSRRIDLTTTSGKMS